MQKHRLADRERSSAFEMWVQRRVEMVSWVDRVTNEEVLQKIGKNIGECLKYSTELQTRIDIETSRDYKTHCYGT